MKAVLPSRLAAALLCSLAAGVVHAKIIALDVDIVLDQASSEEKMLHIGQHHEARVFYDDT